MFTAAIDRPPPASTNSPSCALPRPRAAHHRVVGPARAIPGNDVLRCLAPQFDFCLDRKKRGVRGQDDATVGKQWRIAGYRLVRQYVERRAPEYSSIERREQILQHDDAAARGVDER